MLLVTKLAIATIKQKIDTVLRNLYFKLPADNITLFTLEKFFLEKIDNNIKVNTTFLHSLIQEAAGVKIINTTDCEIDIFVTTLSAANSKENLYF